VFMRSDIPYSFVVKNDVYNGIRKKPIAFGINLLSANNMISLIRLLYLFVFIIMDYSSCAACFYLF